MKEIILGTEVECTDGKAGEITHLVVDPASREVSYYVVKEKARPHVERMVPAHFEVDSTPELITLSCTLAKLSEMAPFTYEVAVQTLSTSSGAGAYERRLASRTYIVDKTNVPEGEQAFSLHSKVEAKDGTVGRVDGILTDEEGEITHLLMRKGHAWGQKEVVIPVSLIEYEHESTVYLKITKDEVAEQLSLTAAWGHGPSEDELEGAAGAE
jgi:hypothetical protein